MSYAFGRHRAEEILGAARVFIDHVRDAEVWPSLSEPLRGRMTDAEVKRGEALYQAASAAMAASAQHTGDVHAPAHSVDDAQHAALDWLHDQLAHARGVLHEAGDEASLAALDGALPHGESHAAVAQGIRAYVKLAQAGDATARAVSASYRDQKSRDAILKDGLHLADALDALSGATDAARAARAAATHEKDADVGQLARWLRRWTLVAHRVVGSEGLLRLGLAAARHHPAHRPEHPAAVAAPAATG